MQRSLNRDELVKAPLGGGRTVYKLTVIGPLYVHEQDFDQTNAQVCVANPPSALTSAGCAPVFPPGCNCDPEV